LNFVVVGERMQLLPIDQQHLLAGFKIQISEGFGSSSAQGLNVGQEWTCLVSEVSLSQSFAMPLARTALLARLKPTMSLPAQRRRYSDGNHHGEHRGEQDLVEYPKESSYL
jgi:hypothetical protein